MHKFVRNLITEWRRLELPWSGTIVVAVSGGADSCALLAAMHDLTTRKKLDVSLVAAHFNHNLRGDESLADEHFVRQFAAGLQVDVLNGSGTIAKRGNLEQNARNARYAFLLKSVIESGAKTLLTGHTMNDQAETFLLNLIRGSGVDGLSAMKAVRPLDVGSDSPLLARPFLRWAKRNDTVAFCTENSIGFRRDTMNENLALSRVRVRNTLIPMLEELNPQIVETLARTAELMQLSDKSHESTFNSHTTLPVAELKTMEKNELFHFLREWLRSVRGDLRGLELQHIASIARLISSRKSGKTIELPGRQTVSKSGGRLVFAEIKVEK